jgi:hypothetical protein
VKPRTTPLIRADARGAGRAFDPGQRRGGREDTFVGPGVQLQGGLVLGVKAARWELVSTQEQALRVARQLVGCQEQESFAAREDGHRGRGQICGRGMVEVLLGEGS